MQEVLTSQDIIIGLNNIKNSQPLFMIWFIILVGGFIATGTLIGPVRKSFRYLKKPNIDGHEYIKILKIYLATVITVCVAMIVIVCFIVLRNLQFQSSIRDAIENDTWFIEIRAVTKKSYSDGNNYALYFDGYIANNISLAEFNRTQYGDEFYIVMVPDAKGVPYAGLFYPVNKYIYVGR